jgi:hypothetical protein
VTVSKTRMGQTRYTKFMTLPGIGILGLGDPASTDGAMPIKSMAKPV